MPENIINIVIQRQKNKINEHCFPVYVHRALTYNLLVVH